MAIGLTDYALWVKGLAARLRILQASFADDNPQTRQTYIAEEIERALKEAPPDKRKEWLEALKVEFPTWQVAPETGAASALAAPAHQTPEELLAQLIEAASTLPEAAKAKFAEKLAAAGLGGKGQALPAFELTPELAKALGFTAGETVTPERAARLFANLLDLTLALDKWVWTLWKEMAAGKSNLRREADLPKMLNQYLQGDTEVSTQQVIQAMDRTRKLNLGLLFGIGRAGSNYATKHLDQFAPEAILDLARLDKGSLFTDEKIKAWKKYVELAKEYDSQPAIERGIQEAIIKAAEDLVYKGRTGS